jgi:hypothetical protein
MSKAISEQSLEVAIVTDLVKGHFVQRPSSALSMATGSPMDLSGRDR